MFRYNKHSYLVNEKGFWGHSGFSILELLLTLTLVSILLICVFHVYLSIKSLCSKIEQNAVLQNHLRFLDYYLQRKITMAGYAGCGKLVNLDVKNNTNFSFIADNNIRGFSSNNLPSQLQKYQIVANSDVVVIQKADEGASRVTDNEIKVGATEFHALENPATIYNNFLLLSDCRKADLFTAQNIGGKAIQTQTPIAHAYQEGAAQVGRFTEIAYFISSSNSENKIQGASKTGLYYAVNYGDKEELLDGVKNMQIRYGVVNKESGNVDNYLDADAVSAGNLWQKVTSVILTITPDAASSGSVSSGSTKVQTWDIYIKLRER